MIARFFMLIAFIIATSSASFAAAPAELAQEGKLAEAVAAYRQAIGAASDNRERARLHRELGDIFAARDEYRAAAPEYQAALAFSQDFPEKDRLRMAVVMSWGGDYSAAIDEFTRIIIENPANLEARLGQARTLAWAGRHGEAVAEAELVLKQDPGNRDALLIKANVLKWQGKVRDSLPIYTGILKGGEDFDARIGLTYALLSAGERRGARASLELLKPAYPYQEKELRELAEALDRATRSNLDFRFSYYDDTDRNDVQRYSLTYKFWLADWNMGASYRHTDSRDPSRNNRAEEFTIQGYVRPLPELGIGGGVGFSQEADGGTTDFFTWNLAGDCSLLRGSAGIAASSYLFNDTAQLIESRIRVTAATLTTTQRLIDRLSLSGTYGFKEYSDDNRSHDFQLSSTVTILTGTPVVQAGYRFRYLDFDRQSGSGYFDPDDFISNQVFVNLSLEQGRFSSFLGGYGGVQSFRRGGSKASGDLFGGVSGLVGYRFMDRLTGEINGEFGNYALQTVTGFEYFQVGARLGLTF